MHCQFSLISLFINSQPILLRDLTELRHRPLGIINIKYLLSTKSLLQSLNLVHLQFLEQRADLGIKTGWQGEQKGRN